MKYLEGMEVIDSDIPDRVIKAMNDYEPESFKATDVTNALRKEVLSSADFAALLSPAAEPYLEKLAARAKEETRKHFGNSVMMFTPLYIANYCENHCIYCGFNCMNKIHRAKLSPEEIDHEMKLIEQFAGERAGSAGTAYFGG